MGRPDAPDRHAPGDPWLSAIASLAGLLALELALAALAFLVLPRLEAGWADRGQAPAMGRRWLLVAGHAYARHFPWIIAASFVAWALNRTGTRRPRP